MNCMYLNKTCEAEPVQIIKSGFDFPGVLEAVDKIRMNRGENVNKAPFLSFVKNHAHSEYSPSSAFPATYEFFKAMISNKKDRLSTAQPSFY